MDKSKLLIGALVAGWGLAILFCGLWLAGRRSEVRLPVPNPARRVPAPSNDLPIARETPGVPSAPEPPPAAKVQAVAKEKPLSGAFFRTDPDGRIQFLEDAERSLGLSASDAATLLASTQAYLDMFRDLEKRHLDVRKFERNWVEFTIEPFPSQGQGIREGLSAVWERTLNPAALAEVRGQLLEMFGGDKEGFGAYRVVVRARREADGDGSVATSEQFFHPSGEKAGSRSGLSIGEDDDPVINHLHGFGPLFKKP